MTSKTPPRCNNGTERSREEKNEDRCHSQHKTHSNINRTDENNCYYPRERNPQYESENDCKAAFLFQYCNVTAAKEYLGDGCSNCPVRNTVGDESVNYCSIFGICEEDDWGSFNALFSPMCTFDNAETKGFYEAYCSPDQSDVMGYVPLHWSAVCDNSTAQKPFSENGWAPSPCDRSSFVENGDGDPRTSSCTTWDFDSLIDNWRDSYIEYNQTEIDGNYPLVYEHGGAWNVYSSMVEGSDTYTHWWIAAGSYMAFGTNLCKVLLHVEEITWLAQY